MDRTQKIEEALAWAQDVRLGMIRERRERLALPGNPFEARPGQEEALEKADGAIFALTTILDELEGASAQTQEEPAAQKPVRLRTLAAGALLSFGLASLATLGFAAACIVIRAPGPAVQASAVVGVALSLAWAVKAAGK